MLLMLEKCEMVVAGMKQVLVVWVDHRAQESMLEIWNLVAWLIALNTVKHEMMKRRANEFVTLCSRLSRERTRNNLQFQSDGHARIAKPTARPSGQHSLVNV